jgi:hypothetical protein
MPAFFLRVGVAGLVLLAACTGAGEPRDAARQARVEAAFAQGFTQVSEEYRAAMSEVQGEGRAALESQDRQKVLAVYRAISDATTQAAKKYGRLTPPSRVAQDFEKLQANLDQQRAALDGVITAVKENRGGSLTDGLQEYSTLLGEFGTIQQTITTALAGE